MIDSKPLEHIIHASHDGIVIAEQEGNDTILLYVNPAFERLTGYKSDEIRYQDCRCLQNSDTQQASLNAIRAAIRARLPCRQIIRNYHKDGHLFWNELSITPVFNADDQLTYFIGIQKDVSAHIAANERIQHLEEELAMLRQQLADSTQQVSGQKLLIPATP